MRKLNLTDAERRERVKAQWRKAAQKYREAHPERRRALNVKTVKRFGPDYYRENHQRLKRAVITAYGGRCECCGETEPEFLSLDHVDGGGTKHRKKIGGGSRLWRWLRDAGWPKRCEFGRLRILCMNCNTATRNGRTCPHQLKKDATQ